MRPCLWGRAAAVRSKIGGGSAKACVVAEVTRGDVVEGIPQAALRVGIVAAGVHEADEVSWYKAQRAVVEAVPVVTQSVDDARHDARRSISAGFIGPAESIYAHRFELGGPLRRSPVWGISRG